MICAISTKTTGLKPGVHEVIEFSIKPLGNTEITFRVRPDRAEIYEENVQKINEISTQVALMFPTKEETMALILSKFPNGFQPMGHHVDFDFNMIKETFGRKFVTSLFNAVPINTALMVEKKNLANLTAGKPGIVKSLALKKTCSELGIPFITKCSAIEAVYNYLENENVKENAVQ